MARRNVFGQRYYIQAGNNAPTLNVLSNYSFIDTNASTQMQEISIAGRLASDRVIIPGMAVDNNPGSTNFGYVIIPVSGQFSYLRPVSYSQTYGYMGKNNEIKPAGITIKIAY